MEKQRRKARRLLRLLPTEKFWVWLRLAGFCRCLGSVVVLHCACALIAAVCGVVCIAGVFYLVWTILRVASAVVSDSTWLCVTDPSSLSPSGTDALLPRSCATQFLWLDLCWTDLRLLCLGDDDSLPCNVVTKVWRGGGFHAETRVVVIDGEVLMCFMREALDVN